MIEMLIQIVAIILLVIGTFFMLIAGLGVVRFPDLYLRMSASTKASTVGVGFTLLATAIYFGEVGVATRAIAIGIFLLLTAPIAAHMMGRAAYSDGVPLWDQTRYNDLKDRYDPETHALAPFEGESERLYPAEQVEEKQ